MSTMSRRFHAADWPCRHYKRTFPLFRIAPRLVSARRPSIARSAERERLNSDFSVSGSDSFSGTQS